MNRMKHFIWGVPALITVGASNALAGATFTPPDVDLSNFYTGASAAIVALVAVVGVVLVFKIYSRIKSA